MRCPSCGQDNPPGSSFCAFCGSPVRMGSLEEETPGQRARSEKKGGWKGLPFYTRVTIAGLLVFAVISQIGGVLWSLQGGVEVIDEVEAIIITAMFFVIPTLVVVVLAWRSGRTLVAAIWVILMLLMNASAVPQALVNFNSFFDGGVMILALASLIVAGVAGTVGFLRHRRGTTRNVSTAGERRVLWATTAAVVGLLVASGTLHVASLESVSAEEKAAAIRVDMRNLYFEPRRLEVPAGKPAKFVIKNRDLTVHTFTIEELGVDVKVVPGSEKLIVLSSPPAGRYMYMCTISNHAELEYDARETGTLVVSEP